MENQDKWDVVQLNEKNLNPRKPFIRNHSWNDCDFYFLYQFLDILPKELRQESSTNLHNQQNDGSDYLFAIRTTKSIAIPRHNQFKSIRLSEIGYIYSIDDRTIIFNNETDKLEYTMMFTNKSKLRLLFETIYEKIPCFYWDLIITNFAQHSYCLLNRYLSKRSYEESEDDEDFDEYRKPLPPKRPTRPPRFQSVLKRSMDMESELLRKAKKNRSKSPSPSTSSSSSSTSSTSSTTSSSTSSPSSTASTSSSSTSSSTEETEEEMDEDQYLDYDNDDDEINDIDQNNNNNDDYYSFSSDSSSSLSSDDDDEIVQPPEPFYYGSSDDDTDLWL